ncbi:hypothetical protein ACFX2F_034592 [Malus domestica]
MAMNGKLNMESLAENFGTSLLLSEKEKGGIKIEKKVVEGALLGFHYSVVAEGKKPWLFRDDLVLMVDGVRHGRWVEPLHLVSMWVQLHNVPPLNMMEAVASVIGGLIGKVLKVDKDDGYDYIGRFLHIKFCFDMRRVTRCCKSEILGEEASEVDTKALYAFKGLDAEYDLRGNWLGLIGPGGSITPEARQVVLVNHPEVETGITKTTEVLHLQPVQEIDLNIHVMVETIGSYEGITKIGVIKTRIEDCLKTLTLSISF